MTRRRVLLLTLGALLCLSACGGEETVGVRVERGGEIILEVQAPVAATSEDRARGLSEETGLAPDEGLLLLLPRETEACVINENVSFAIDAIYAGDDDRVVAVARDIAPGDPEGYCEVGVIKILLVGAGVAADVMVADGLFVEL